MKLRREWGLLVAGLPALLLAGQGLAHKHPRRPAALPQAKLLPKVGSRLPGKRSKLKLKRMHRLQQMLHPKPLAVAAAVAVAAAPEARVCRAT